MAFPKTDQEIFMKKRFLAVVTALLALAVLSCDAFSASKDVIEYTEDGRPLVTLDIGANRSRALTDALARAGTDYFEVTFQENGNIYRASWDYTKRGRIKVPAATYTGASNAILFAGTQSDKTLLAIGIITEQDSGGTPGVITATTRQVTFTLYPLLSNIQASNASTFQILTPTSHETITQTSGFPTANINGKNYPLFQIPREQVVTASYAITTATPTTGIGTYVPGIHVISQATIFSTGLYTPSKNGLDGDKPVALTGPITTNFPTIGLNWAGTPTAGLIGFSIPAQTQRGLSRLSFELPVCAIIDTAATNPIEWYIRGGLNNGQLDEGGGAINSLGGAVLLGVDVGGGLIINTQFTP